MNNFIHLCMRGRYCNVNIYRSGPPLACDDELCQRSETDEVALREWCNWVIAVNIIRPTLWLWQYVAAETYTVTHSAEYYDIQQQ